MLRYLPLIWKNSVRNRRRSILTVCSLAASLCLLGLLFAVYRALFLADAPPSQALRVITHHRVSITQSLPVSYEARIQQVPGVKYIMVWQWFGGTYKDARDQKNFFARFAVEPDKFWLVRSEFEAPEEQKQAFIHNRTGVVAEETLARKMNWHLGDRIMIQGDIFPVNLELTLVGIYKDPEKSEAIFFSQAYLRELVGPGRGDQVGSFAILANSPDDVPKLSKTIDAMFENSPAQTKTETEQAFALFFTSFIGNVKVFLMAICAAVTFTILLVSANTMAMSVRERIREVGILKTLGFSNRAILGIVLGEAALIALIGGGIGILLAQGLAMGVRSSPVAAFFQALKGLSITPAVGLFCLVLAMFIGVASALVPAAGAARTSILDALKNTD
jgi:putative ABC transport system permease protein